MEIWGLDWNWSCRLDMITCWSQSWLFVFVPQLRFRAAWWVQGMSAAGLFSASPTTPARSKACTISASLCCTTPVVTTHRWGEVWRFGPLLTLAWLSALFFFFFFAEPFPTWSRPTRKIFGCVFYLLKPLLSFGRDFCCIRSRLLNRRLQNRRREQFVCFPRTDVHERVT